jgi:hypothetical protein
MWAFSFHPLASAKDGLREYRQPLAPPSGRSDGEQRGGTNGTGGPGPYQVGWVIDKVNYGTKETIPRYIFAGFTDSPGQNELPSPNLEGALIASVSLGVFAAEQESGPGAVMQKCVPWWGSLSP